MLFRQLKIKESYNKWRVTSQMLPAELSDINPIQVI